MARNAIATLRPSVLAALADLQSHCTIPQTEGAFYVFPKINTNLNPMNLVERLIRDYQVAVIPGSAFGMDIDCYLRVAYGALEPETVGEGINRLVSGLSAILTA